jgi:hypothetical protein
LNRAWHRLDGWPDTVEGLIRLKRKYILATLSNGNVALMVNMALNRQTAANNGFVFIPPDTILGKSLTQFIEATNSAIRFTDTAGGVLATTDLNTFFGARI